MALPALNDLTDKLAAFVEDDSDDTFVQDAAGEAIALLTRHIRSGYAAEGAPTLYDIPDEIGMRAALEVGADLYYRRTARNGIVGINIGDVSPVRIQRDPMTAAYPLLAPYVGGPIA